MFARMQKEAERERTLMKKANIGHVFLWWALKGRHCLFCGIDFDPLDIMEDIAYDNGHWMHKTCLEDIENSRASVYNAEVNR